MEYGMMAGRREREAEGAAAVPQDLVGVQDPGASENVRGRLKLLLTSNAVLVTSGDLVTISIHILNVGDELLEDVSLIPRRFTNAAMAELQYTQFPAQEELLAGTLLPGMHVGWNVQYLVSILDVVSGGPIISSMAATAITAGGETVREESDLILNVQ